MKLKQADVNYEILSPQVGIKECAGCRWYGPGGACAVVENYPLPIRPTGFCDRYTERPENENEGRIISQALLQQMAREEGLLPGVIRMTPDRRSVQRGTFDAIWSHIRRNQLKTGAYVLKRDGGKLRRAVIISSNGFKDREDEHVARKALEEYVRDSYRDGEWVGDNPLLFYHEDDLIIGRIIAAAMVDGFLVEVAEEIDDPIARALWNYWENTPDLQWGASISFTPLDEEGGVYRKLEKRETSLLGLEDAANPYTLAAIVQG